MTTALKQAALVAFLCAVVVISGLGYHWLKPAAPEAPAVSEAAPEAPAPAPDREARARAQLAELEVKGKAGLGGYDRDLFGDDWYNNGGLEVIDSTCDTRNTVLAQHAEYLALDDDGCTVTWGVIRDPYSGELVDFTRGDGRIEVDHVVSLANAWHTGAFAWDPHTRRTFAHDPANLQPTLTELNQQKKAGDAATWLPPNKAHRCAFATQQIQVKHTYGLWVAPAERDALLRQLDTC